MRRSVVLLAALALLPVTASADPGGNGKGHAYGLKKQRYLVGAAVESINPPQSMIDGNDIFLGGYGLPTGGRVVSRKEAQVLPGRTAVGILGEGVATRALVVS